MLVDAATYRTTVNAGAVRKLEELARAVATRHQNVPTDVGLGTTTGWELRSRIATKAEDEREWYMKTYILVLGRDGLLYQGERQRTEYSFNYRLNTDETTFGGLDIESWDRHYERTEARDGYNNFHSGYYSYGHYTDAIVEALEAFDRKDHSEAIARAHLQSKQQSADRTAKRTLPRPVIIAVALVAVTAAVAIAWPSSDESGSAAWPVTQSAPCTAEPTITASRFALDDRGLLSTLHLSTSCPAGDILSSSATTLSVSTNGVEAAAAVFDLSDAAIEVPTGPAVVERTFRFPEGTFLLPPDSIATYESVVQYRATVESAAAAPRRMSTSAPLDAVGPTASKSGDSEAATRAALQAITAADRTPVGNSLADRWVPQLSSKRLGLVAEGTTWTTTEILHEHLSLRMHYPNVRLLWSGDWNTFSAPDFWVTVAGITYPTADEAVAWCRSNSFDRDHCYAKLVSTTHPIDGSTKLQPS